MWQITKTVIYLGQMMVNTDYLDYCDLAISNIAFLLTFFTNFYSIIVNIISCKTCLIMIVYGNRAICVNNCIHLSN